MAQVGQSVALDHILDEAKRLYQDSTRQRGFFGDWFIRVKVADGKVTRIRKGYEDEDEVK